MTNKLFLIFFLFSGQVVFSQNFNRPVPPTLYPYEFTINSNTPGYYLTVPAKQGLTPANPNFLSTPQTILDGNGYVVWYYDNQMVNADFKYYPEHSLFSYTNAVGPALTMYYILDMDLNIIDSITNTPNYQPEGHEFQILSNGNYIFAAEKDTVMDLSAYTFDGITGGVNTTVESFVLQEFDPSHNLVFEWSSIDHIFPTEGYPQNYGYNVNAFDYAHGNAIEEDTDGNLLVSFRNLNAVYKIDHTTGDVIWILGGLSSDFTFPNDIGFSGQHDIRRLPNGDVSLFDNANCAPFPRKSRGVQYTLDTVNWTATRSWQYIHTPSFFARAMGSHQVDPNNKHLINYGNNYRPNPSFLLTDANGNILTEMNFRDSVMSYRSFYYDDIPFTFQRPQISCNNTGSQIELSAPIGHTNYVWSTGETSSTIVVNTTDTFQVWVDHGMGMLGSEPFIVTDIQNNCLSGLNPENENNAPTKLIAYYDLLGREVKDPIEGNLYIARYSNGANQIIYTGK